MTLGPDDFHGTVVHRERLSAGMVRLVLGGPGMAGWGSDLDPDDEATDAYFVLFFPPPGAPYAAPFSVEQVEEEHGPELRPLHRHYTVRAWDAEREELSVDFVVHGDDGLAGPWAQDAQIGDTVVLTQSHGAYRPDPTADWHLMVGDESAVPAIAASLDALDVGAHAVAVLVCDGPDHEVALPTRATLDLRWLHRAGDADDAQLLVEAVRALTFPDGTAHGFVHGEAGEVREVRRHLLGERGMPRGDLSVSGYWRRTMTDEAWRRVKRDWNAQVEADVVEQS